MSNFVKVMEETDLPIGKSAIVTVGENEIALFNYKGKYYAVENECLHQGASLGEGRIEEGILICPNHEWRYELETGQCPQNPGLRAKIFSVKVHKGAIQIDLGKTDSKNTVKGKDPNKLPSSVKFSIPVIQQPRNPDEELG